MISMPVTLPQQVWRTANDAQLHEWASVFTQQARRGIEAQGSSCCRCRFFPELIGDWLGISFKMRIVDAEDCLRASSNLRSDHITHDRAQPQLRQGCATDLQADP